MARMLGYGGMRRGSGLGYGIPSPLPLEFNRAGAIYYGFAPAGYERTAEQMDAYENRWYTSLGAGVAAIVAAGSPSNPVILNGLGTWSGYEDFNSARAIAGLTLTENNYLLVRGIGTARANGKWSTTAWRGRLNNTLGNVLDISTSYTTIEGLQFHMQATPTTSSNTAIIYQRAGSNLLIDSCILRGHGVASTFYTAGMYADLSATMSAVVRNSLVYDWTASVDTGFGICPAGGSSSIAWKLYNNTIYNCSRGIYWAGQNNAASGAWNCVLQDCSYRSFDGAVLSGAYNVVDDAYGQGTDLITGEVAFVDEAGRDLHLSDTDTVAFGRGADLSSLFGNDGAGKSRIYWSPGMDDGPTPLPNVILYGNSLWAGYGLADPATQACPVRLAELLGERVVNVVNEGHNSMSWAWLDTNWNTYVVPHLLPRRPNVVVLIEWFNSFYEPPYVDVATAVASCWSVCAKARAAGCTVVLCDFPVVRDSWGVSAQLSQACAIVEADWRLHADAFVKTRTLFSDPESPLYQSDGLHPGPDDTGPPLVEGGALVLARMIYAALAQFVP